MPNNEARARANADLSGTQSLLRNAKVYAKRDQIRRPGIKTLKRARRRIGGALGAVEAATSCANMIERRLLRANQVGRLEGGGWGVAIGRTLEAPGAQILRLNAGA